MIKYKLTNQKMQTYNGFQWKLGERIKAKGSPDQPLCTDGWLHCYDSPLLAILHNPIHANITNPRLFEAEVAGKYLNEKGMKCGFRKMRLVKEIPLPEINKIQKIAYGILCAKEFYKNKTWNRWANNWLTGKNRTKTAAHAAAHVAYVAYAADVADAADVAHVAYVAYAADVADAAAADAADAADVAYVAYVADVADAADVADVVYAAHAADVVYAAHAAAYAAAHVAYAVDNINFEEIANKSMNYS